MVRAAAAAASKLRERVAFAKSSVGKPAGKSGCFPNREVGANNRLAILTKSLFPRIGDLLSPPPLHRVPKKIGNPTIRFAKDPCQRRRILGGTRIISSGKRSLSRAFEAPSPVSSPRREPPLERGRFNKLNYASPPLRNSGDTVALCMMPLKKIFLCFNLLHKKSVSLSLWQGN